MFLRVRGEAEVFAVLRGVVNAASITNHYGVQEADAQTIGKIPRLKDVGHHG